MTDNTAPMFITGDRMYAMPYLPQVAIEMMRALAAGQPIMTGTNPGGVEAIVRSFADEAGIDVQVVEHSLIEGTTWGDWDKRHAALPADAEIVIVHADPQSDTLTKMLLASNPDSRLVVAGI